MLNFYIKIVLCIFAFFSQSTFINISFGPCNSHETYYLIFIDKGTKVREASNDSVAE